MAQCIMNLTSGHEDVGLVPDLARWVGDLALLGAVVWITHAALIACCCGCDVGLQLQLWMQPLAWELLYAASVAPKTKKKKKIQNVGI